MNFRCLSSKDIKFQSSVICTSFTELYRWSIILADTDFFQQSVSVSAADFRGRNNRPSAKHFFFIKFWNFMSAHFGTVTQCSVEHTVPKCAHQNSVLFNQSVFGSYEVTCAQACMLWFVDKQTGEMEVYIIDYLRTYQK